MSLTATTLIYANGARIRITMAAGIYKYLQIRCAASNFSCYHLVISILFRKKLELLMLVHVRLHRIREFSKS